MQVTVSRLLTQLLIVQTFLVLPCALFAGGNWRIPSSKVMHSDLDRACLILDALEDAMNEPSAYNLDVISALAPNGDKETWTDLIRRQALALSGGGPTDTGAIALRLDFSPNAMSRSNDTLRLHVFTECGYGQMLVRDSMVLRIGEQSGRYSILNLNDNMRQIAATIDSTRKRAKSAKDSELALASVEAIAVSDYSSPKLLNPKEMFPGSTRFTRAKSYQYYEAPIFSAPYAVLALEYDDPGDALDRDYLIIGDMGWGRIMASENVRGWVQPYGSLGNDTAQFRSPLGLAWVDWHWVVADGLNNRAMVYRLDYSETLDYLYTLEDDFDYVSDVAAARIPRSSDPSGDFCEIAVLDRRNGQVKLYDLAGNLKSTLFSRGSGTNQLLGPTSICYARNKVDHLPMHYLYVADEGNNRVIMRHPDWPSRFYATPPGVFPADAVLRSVTVDAYGNVYVLEQSQSYVYVFSPNLEDLIAVYGVPGSGADEFHIPHRLTIAQAWKYVPGVERLVPEAIGDVFVTEMFSTDTGIRRYVLGCDVLAHQLRYVPALSDSWDDYLRFDWHQTGVARAIRTIYSIDYGWEESLSCDTILTLPGTSHTSYFLKDTPDNVLYVFETRLTSVYPHVAWAGDSVTLWSTDTTFRDTISVCRFIDTTCGNYDVVFPVKGVSINDPNFEVPTNCFYFGDNRWWQAVAGTCGYYDSTRCTLFYHWTGGPFYEDTLQALGSTELVTTQKRVFLRLPIPEGFAGPDTFMRIGEVRITFSDDTPYVSGFPFMDTAYFESRIYASYCATPCTSCVTPSCPVLYYWSGEDWEFVNNILPQAEERLAIAVDKLDVYPIYRPGPADKDGYHLLIKEEDNEISYFDQFSLVALDVPLAKKSPRHVGREGLVSLTDKSTAPSSAITHRGEDVLGKLVAADGRSFTWEEPGYIDVEYEFGKIASTLSLGDQVDPGAIEIADPDKDVLTKVAVGTDTDWVPNIYTVSARNADGELETVGKLYPRRRSGQHLIDLSDRSVDGVLRIRLEWTRRITLDALPCIGVEKLEPVVTPLRLVSAVHSTEGAVTSSLSRLTAERVTVRPGELIELTYEAQPPPDDMVRILAFVARGRYETMTELTETAVAEAVEGLVLEQNYPNPFNPTTIFSFALPQAAEVKLEVYNVLGMRVATLVDSRLEAGRHTREWNGRNADGQLVASGVYFARLTAGKFAATKKMVVVK